MVRRLLVDPLIGKKGTGDTVNAYRDAERKRLVRGPAAHTVSPVYEVYEV
jgi:hypothetical protein